MKVTDTNQIKGLGSATRAETARGPAERASSSSDRVSTDESARLATTVETATQTASATRAAKLQVIEAAVREGTYRPDPQRIAQEILEDAELAARLQALLSK